MAKTRKKITRAMKIEMTREAKAKEAKWRKSIWFPVPGDTFEEAVDHVIMLENERENLNMDDERFGEINEFINKVPLVVMNGVNRARSNERGDRDIPLKVNVYTDA